MDAAFPKRTVHIGRVERRTKKTHISKTLRRNTGGWCERAVKFKEEAVEWVEPKSIQLVRTSKWTLGSGLQ
jgi:hypothetical protein